MARSKTLPNLTSIEARAVLPKAATLLGEYFSFFSSYLLCNASLDHAEDLRKRCLLIVLVRLKSILQGSHFTVNYRDGYGFTALHYAASGQYEEMCRFLLENGADVNAQTVSVRVCATRRS